MRLSHGSTSLNVTATEPQPSRSPKRGANHSPFSYTLNPSVLTVSWVKCLERMSNIIISLFIMINTILQCCDITICRFSMVVDYPESWTNILKLQISRPLSSICRLLIVSHYTISSLWEQTKRIKECAEEQQKLPKLMNFLEGFSSSVSLVTGK